MHAFISSVNNKISNWHLFWQTFKLKNRDSSPLREQPWRKRWRAGEKALWHTHTHTHTHTHRERETDSKTKQDHESRHLWWLESQMTTEPLFQRRCVEQGRVAWVHQTLANASPLVCTLVNVGVLPGWGSRGRAEGVSWGKVLFLQGLDQIGSVFGVHTPQRALPINLEETTTHTQIDQQGQKMTSANRK